MIFLINSKASAARSSLSVLLIPLGLFTSAEAAAESGAAESKKSRNIQNFLRRVAEKYLLSDDKRK